MSKETGNDPNPFSGAVVGLIVAIGLISFSAAFALIGWAPELADRDRAGEHPYSTSAIGYQGLIRLLQADGHDVSITRTADARDYAPGLLIVTIPHFGFNRLDDFEVTDVSEPVLYVLPKWRGRVDRSQRSWHEDTRLLRLTALQSLIENFDRDASISRSVDLPNFDTPIGPSKLNIDNAIQVIKSEWLIGVVETQEGQLISRLPGTEIYVLADPDILNTFGISRPDNARFALGLIDNLLPYEGAPITLDATVHGFERATNLLKAILDAPFVGATLISFMTMLLVGWGASVRLAPPQQEDRAIALGKKALADNSAALIAMARRETTMAPRYLETSRRAMLRRLGLPRNTEQATLTLTLNALIKKHGNEATFDTTAEPLKQPARSREDLTEKAQRLWRWRKETIDGD
ncbi:MAG: DUF4350 domain-containing protein [Pseudomonadota bacterium]